MTETPPLAYLWGEDAFGIEHAAQRFAERIAPPGEAMATWRVGLDDDSGEDQSTSAPMARRRVRVLDEIEQHLAMAPLFGAGTLVVLRQPAVLLAEKATRERLLGLVASIPAGNALCVTDLIASGAKGPAARGVLHDVIAAAGGLIEEFTVPGPGRLEPWLRRRAEELGSSLDPAAAKLLAQRIGGHVREADVDRRRRTELANSELEKLALHRPGDAISSLDVEALVSESIPGSTWAFLDAVGTRSRALASELAERLLAEGTPMPVLVTQLHRRLRDLVMVREHLDRGSAPPQIVKSLRLQPYRAKKLAQQAARWSLESLEAALADLLDVDLRSKGIALDGSTLQMSEHIDALVLQTWLARHASSREATGSDVVASSG